MKRYCVHFAEIVKEEFYGRNSPWIICKVSRTVRSCKGARELRVNIFASSLTMLQKVNSRHCERI
jgi:hypothetical protein